MGTKHDDKLSWIDYTLIVCFFAVSALIFIGIKYQLDIIIGGIVPIGVLIITSLVFINYLTSITSFSKKISSKDEEIKD